MSINPTELTETQKAYNVAQYELFQLAAYGHCTYTNGEMLTDEGKRQQADYNDRIRAAREELEASLLRLVAEHAETCGSPFASADWLRSLADDPAGLSLLAVRPDEREDADPSAVSVVPPATNQTAEEHRLALSEALGLGTGAPWDAIHDRVTELGLPPLDQDPVARRLGLLAAYRAAVLTEAATRYEEILANADTGQDPRYWTAVRDITLGLRAMAAEAPHAETPDDAPPREPHPTEADLHHALAVFARFHGRDTTAPAVVAQPGKETRPIPCNAVHLRVHHTPHGWEPQPGMEPIPCPGYPTATP